MPQEQPVNDNEMKQQAIRRVLIAIALIMVAIVVLNALSRLKESQQKVLTTNKEPSVASAALTSATPAKEITASIIEKPASTISKAEPVSSKPSEQVVASHPAPPVVINNATGNFTTPSSTVPENNTITTVDNLPGTPLALPAKPIIKSPVTSSKPAPTPAPVVAPISSSSEKITKTAPTPIAPAPAAIAKTTNNQSPPTLSVQSYTVQVGVFGQYENANTLYQKLKDQGIPVRLESRVVVGPFKDKSAASAALRELESLGIKPVVIPNVINSK